MLSPGGRCKTFDNGADGFVPGEGAAAVVLKPLELAVEEGDHIYGVIKGSEINQDGKTNGITAPSATSQTTLECEVYDRFKIHPETISYIEAHGTGTKLGDPIEIQALTAAFNKYTQNRHYCAVGSVKTNIGHTLHAAGIAGLIKVLLSLQHKQLPPSLNFKKANEHINFRESPFYVNTQLKEWPGEGNLPRRAAVSSFGFSGTNCHIIVEEAPVNGRKIPGNGSPYYLIPLSAKTASSLRKKMEDISQWLDKEGKKHSINDIAYTLSVGRSHFSVRSALLVKEPHDLEQKLKPILAGAAGEDCFTNKVESKSPGPAPVFKELGRRLIEELKNAGGMEAGTYKEKLYALADLYTQGYDLDWRDLYEGRDCCRISLPTYPFDLERYWISESERDGAIHGGNKKRSHSEVSLLHPLIGRNISTLQEEKFVTHFTGHEFYLSHHIINGQKILPGVAFIEMVRAAGELAGEKPVAGLRNIVWLRPIVQTKNGKEIYISLYPNPGSDKIDFEVSSSGEDNQRFVHARGQLTYENPGEPGMNHEPVDIDEIKQRCTGKMEGKTCYRLYREMGLRLGPGFQVVQELYSNETEVLSLLRLPEELNEGFNDFILHPSMMDGSLQSGIALGKTEQENSPLLIPFFIGEVDILAPLSKICYGHLKVAGKPQSAEPGSSRCDVRIMDETGKVLVKMKDCQARPLPPTIQGAAMKSKIEETARMYFHSVWEKKELAQMEGKLPGCILIFDFDRAVFDAVKRRLETEPDHGKEYNSRLFLVKPGEHYQDLGNHTYEINPGQMADYRQFFKGLELQSQEPVRIIHNWSQSYENCAANDRNEEDIKSQLDHGIYSLFHLSRVLMNQNVGNKNKFEILYIYPGHEDGPLPQYAALSGFAKTIRWENSNFIYKTVEIRNSSGSQVLDASLMAEVILKELQAGMDEGKGIEVSYRNEHRWEKVWKAFDPGREVEELEPLKEKGVYLITGGMGGLGMIFARYLAKKVKARLVLAGRSDLGAEEKTCLQELESLGSEVVYIRTDVSKYEDVKNLIKKAKSRYQSIDGIIHSAGITRDAFLQKKTPEDMEEVLAPKIYGTRYLDGATREENLDFFVLFSSTAAVLGNVGQCDYAYANSFMDYFAERREILRQKQERSGKTFSINWPLWQEGRLKVNKPTGEFLQRTMGVTSLEKGVGLKAFAEILASGERQVMILAGESQKIRQIVENSQGVNKQKPMDANLAEPGHQVNGKQDELWRKIQKDVVKMVSAISKVKENRLSDNKNLAEYGFDSITFVEFTNTINKKFNLGITPAVFFEYPSLGTFTGYLYKQYRESFARYYREHAVSSGRPIINKGHEDIPVEKKISTRFQDRALGFARKQPGRRGQEEIEPAAIAIIGMSGVMPQSENLDIFWKHLEAGEDLITKIPRERWELGDMNEVVRGGFMKEVDKFDALFFGISPREAELMDPQQRIFLETAWKTIEDAGYRVSDLSGTRTGVFVGVSTSDYGDIIRANEMKVEPHLTTGMSHCVLANRISYLFNFHGPSEPIDTACSSALIALHRAVESIRGGNCEMAIAGGVNVLLSPAVFISFSKAGMLSPDGRCKTFDKRANGYVRGEGSGAVFLKPLARAIKDGDHIYAVIKGTAVNHGGHASSLTAPNPVAQADLLIEAYEKAGIDPSTVTYIEAHGTGTSLGDPVEINGLKRAFAELYKRRGQSPRQGYCGIGSVKTNIGHLEAAAGIAGLLKVLLAMKHKKLPANVHFKELNPYIQLENSPFYILKETRPWENFPRRAGVSSFGFGGANAHLVLEEYKHPVSPQAPPTREPQIIVLSARNEERLKTYARNIVDFLEKSESSVTSSTSSISARTNRNRENLLENIQKTISDFISEIINVGEDDIDLRENIAEYGFDPVRFSDLANRMSKKYELEIKTDIFSEYSSINKLAQYVIMHKHIPGSPGSPDSAASGQSDQNDRNSPPSPLNLPDIAYTLQVGRKPMEERLAVIASGIREVRESLTHYCQEDVDGDGDIENFFHGNSGESKSISGLLLEGNEGREYQDIIFHEKKFEKLAKLWVSGVDINWELLYRGNPPNRVSLPTYPFARERYWVAMNKPMRKPGIEISPTREQHGESSEIPPPAVVENDGKSYRDILFAHKPGQRKDMLESFLSEKIARMLRLSSTQKLDPRQPLVNVGLDSLMALQLKKEIEVDLRMNVSMIKFLGGESAADMAGLLLRHLVDNDQNKETGISPTTKMKAAADLDDLQNDLIEGVL
jgi:polyketide synthase PksN